MLDELQRRNYTTDTIRGYIHAIKEFAEWHCQVEAKSGRLREMTAWV
jgi:hypothetical protein